MLSKKLKDFFGGYTASGPVQYMVVGLGNPGAKYENTRHNAGFLAVDHIAGKLGISVDRVKFKSLCGDAMVAGTRVLFLKPATFMNKSGEAVVEAMQFYKIPVENILVLFDDVSLPPGHLRIRRKGSDGGQKGVRSIIYLTGQDTFPRIKIGVGAKPHPDMDLADWVLSGLTQKDRETLAPTFEQVRDAVELIVSGRIAEAMNRYNQNGGGKTAAGKESEAPEQP